MNVRLTDRQENFCHEYIVDYNAKAAAIRAGYSEKTAAQIGYQLLRKDAVAGRMTELQNEAYDRLHLHALRVVDMLLETQQMAQTDGEYGAAIRAAELIGKHLGMFTDKHEVSLANQGQLQSLLESRQRRREEGDG